MRKLLHAIKRVSLTAPVDDDFPEAIHNMYSTARYMEDIPHIVCLCGSTRFWEAFRDHGLRFTLEGKIVLSIGIHAPDSMTFAHATDTEGMQTKIKLDELHKRKIDLADSIFVLNVGGYIGHSTQSEIAYAQATGKQVDYLE
jgi:hypothetical protein